MTIGSQFLSRLLNEAKKDEKNGFTFDRSVEAMKRAMRDIGGEGNYADKIAEVFSMVGIPGMYLNKPEVRESVIEGAQNLKSKPARVRAFLALHSALSTFHGTTPIVEAKAKKSECYVDFDEDTELWCVFNEAGKALSSYAAKSDAVRDCANRNGLNEAKAKSGEDDLEGNLFQQTVEEILVTLGLPEEMVGSGAKASIKTGLRRMVSKLRADSSVKSAFVTFARLAGIKAHDKIVGAKKSIMEPKEPVTEAEEIDAQAPAINMSDIIGTARTIFGHMGLNLDDDSIIKLVNRQAFVNSVKVACRDAKVKQAMAAFLRAVK